MTTLNWRDVTVHDMASAMTLENQIRAVCAFGGIHQFDFQSELEDDPSGTIGDIWDTASATGTWSYARASLQGVGGGSSQWYHLISNDDMPEAGVLTFDKWDDRGAVLLRATDEDNCYRLYWDSSDVVLHYVEDGTPTQLIALPKVYGGKASVVVAWREVQYTLTDPYRWLFISIWFDGELALTYGDNIETKTLGQKVGFGVYESDTITFERVRVPELAVIGDWASLDENESPGGSLARIIGQRHIRMFCRYDGTLRVWRPAAVASSETIGDARIVDMVRTIDRRELLSHVRVQGAYVTADVTDTDLLKQIGHRYQRLDVSHLETEEECVIEAGFFLQSLKENAETVEFRSPPFVLLEPEDRVTISEGDYLIVGTSIQLGPGRYSARLRLRKYVE